MKISNTFWAKIYVGFRPGYIESYDPEDDNQKNIDLNRVKDICREYCDDVKLCVNIQPTTFIYVEGEENGAVVELINYPRFEVNDRNIRNKAINLGRILKHCFSQNRISVMFPDTTIMIEEDIEEDIEPWLCEEL